MHAHANTHTHTSSSSSMGSSASKLTGAGIASIRGFFAGCGASEGEMSNGHTQHIMPACPQLVRYCTLYKRK